MVRVEKGGVETGLGSGDGCVADGEWMGCGGIVLLGKLIGWVGEGGITVRIACHLVFLFPIFPISVDCDCDYDCCCCVIPFIEGETWGLRFGRKTVHISCYLSFFPSFSVRQECPCFETIAVDMGLHDRERNC